MAIDRVKIIEEHRGAAKKVMNSAIKRCNQGQSKRETRKFMVGWGNSSGDRVLNTTAAVRQPIANRSSLKAN